MQISTLYEFSTRFSIYHSIQNQLQVQINRLLLFISFLLTVLVVLLLVQSIGGEAIGREEMSLYQKTKPTVTEKIDQLWLKHAEKVRSGEDGNPYPLNLPDNLTTAEEVVQALKNCGLHRHVPPKHMKSGRRHFFRHVHKLYMCLRHKDRDVEVARFYLKRRDPFHADEFIAGLVSARDIPSQERIKIFSSLSYYPTENKVHMEKTADHLSLVKTVGHYLARAESEEGEEEEYEWRLSEMTARMAGAGAFINTAHKECCNIDNLVGDKKTTSMATAVEQPWPSWCQDKEWGVFVSNRDIKKGDVITLYYGSGDIVRKKNFVCPNKMCPNRRRKEKKATQVPKRKRRKINESEQIE